MDPESETSAAPATLFAPFESLAGHLLPYVAFGSDGSHDIGHLARVFRTALRLVAEEGGDAEVVAAAVLLHDCVQVEKDSPLRSEASRLAAERARAVLASLGWETSRTAAVAHAVHAHSFSARIKPETVEARVVQDADRLDALGAIGIARCFYVAGRLGRGLYDPFDPHAQRRDLDDIRFALDHFETKLFRLKDSFQTAAGRRLAEQRHAQMAAFVKAFHAEI